MKFLVIRLQFKIKYKKYEIKNIKILIDFIFNLIIDNDYIT